MPYTKIDLQTLYSLSPEEVDQTLTAAKLPFDSETYTDEEIQSRFDVIRNYFSSKQVSDYPEAAELFSQRTAQELETQDAVSTQPGKSNKSNNSNENGADEDKQFEMSELLSLASEKCGIRIKLSYVSDILAACGLPETEQYTLSECDRFLEACDLCMKQNKTYEEVAAHFGVEFEDTHTDIESNIDSAAAAVDRSGQGVVSEVMRHKAAADASVAASLYLKHLANEFGSPEFQQAWNQMEEMLKAKVMGKSRMRARLLLGEVRVIPPSPSPSNALPATLDNGSTPD